MKYTYKPVKRLFSKPETQYKMNKGFKVGYYNLGLFLAPYNIGGVNICPSASEGCIAGCLNTAGRGQMTSVQLSRLNKKYYFLANRPGFLKQLDHEIKTKKKYCDKNNLTLAVRLNGTSDLPYERYKLENGLNLMENNPDVIFYDYTKIKNRLDQKLPDNYSLTFSKSESNDQDVQEVLKNGGNAAIVFKDKLPEVYLNKTVIDGDKNDLRFKDPKNIIVGLVAKGKAKKDQSGFVVNY